MMPKAVQLFLFNFFAILHFINHYLLLKCNIFMKSEEIKQLFVQFEQAACEINQVECWSARELCPLLGYTQ